MHNFRVPANAGILFFVSLLCRIKTYFISSYRVTRRIGFRVVPVGARYGEMILYDMTDRQIAIADRLLNILLEHDGRANKHGVRKMLTNEFTERLDTIDITMVFDTLADNYELIAYMGEAWVRLTPEGERMAKNGMKNYQRKLSLKEWWKGSQVAAIITAALSAVVGALITAAVTLLIS